MKVSQFLQGCVDRGHRVYRDRLGNVQVSNPTPNITFFLENNRDAIQRHYDHAKEIYLTEQERRDMEAAWSDEVETTQEIPLSHEKKPAPVQSEVSLGGGEIGGYKGDYNRCIKAAYKRNPSYPDGYLSPGEWALEDGGAKGRAMESAVKGYENSKDSFEFDQSDQITWVKSRNVYYRIEYDFLSECVRCNCMYRNYNHTCKHEIAREKELARRSKGKDE